MKPPRRTIFVIVPLAILLLPIAIYVVDRVTASDEITRNVTIAGVPVGGLDPTDATVAVEVYENDLRSSTGVFTVNGRVFKLSPVGIGLDADIEAALDDAMNARRNSGMIGNFTSWIRSFSTFVDIPLPIDFDDDAIQAAIADWEAAAIPNRAFNGSLAVVDHAVVVEYPQEGETIDRTSAVAMVKAEMSTLNKAGMTIPVDTEQPKLSREQIDAAALEMEQMIARPMTLRSREVSFRVTFTPEQLASAVRADITPRGDSIDVRFDAERVLEILEPRRSEYEVQPVDARFDIDLETDDFTVIPARSGTLLDVDSLLEEMKQAAMGSGVGTFPVLVGAEPAFTTEDAQAFTTLGPLGGFTTEHPANQARVINIHQMADDVDGAIVLPGQEWSINEYVGERTERGGYVAAPAIINGEPYCCDNPANIGGGVSQFGTTLFNAVFFSCLEDVEHRPHSLSFTRYPAGREATLGFPKPDVKFRNNTDYPVIVKTAYTPTSITVKMYGNNGGLVCESVSGEKEDIVPFEIELVADTEDVLNPGERRKERNGIDGFKIHVDRVVNYPDGRQETDLNLDWRYRPLSEKWTVHPCEVSGEPLDCPVQLPSVVGQTWEQALTTLSEYGMLSAKKLETVGNPSKDNVVIFQDPRRYVWVKPGTTITLTVGTYEG